MMNSHCEEKEISEYRNQIVYPYSNIEINEEINIFFNSLESSEIFLPL